MQGILAGNTVIITDTGGNPIRELAEPPHLDGYVAVSKWVDTGAEIQRQWHYEPVQGSEQDATVTLARMYIADHPLTDDQAFRVPALYPTWDGDGAVYKKGTRVLYQGTLYNVLSDHTSQPGWTPDKAPSLFSKVLPGQSGSTSSTAEWVQPDSTNPYKKGDRVTHDGKTWESTSDNNVWEPGATGAPWTEVSA